MGINLQRVSPRARKLMLAIATGMAATMLYGVVFYPDGPIHPCLTGTGYCGKHGEVRTLADYEAFRRWEIVLPLVWIGGLISIFSLSGDRTDK